MKEKRNCFFEEISRPESSGTEKRAKFEVFLRSAETSKLFEAAEDETAQMIMKTFTAALWKISSRNSLNQNLLQFFITSHFKASLVYLLRHPNPHVKEMVFERDMAGRAPLMVGIKSLAVKVKDNRVKAKDNPAKAKDNPVILAIWDVMKSTSDEKIKEHFKNYDKDILLTCATQGQNNVLIQIALMFEKSDILLRKNEEDRTVFDLCNCQKTVHQLLERLSTQTNMEDALKGIKDKNKEKNILHHWAAKNFDDAIDFFRKKVSPSVFTDMLFEKSANGSTPMMVSALNGAQECLQIFLFFLSLEMKEWEPAVKKERMDIILHEKNQYNNTLLSLVLKQTEILHVSKHLLLSWEKINHKESEEGTKLADQAQRKAVTRCMKMHLKPSVEVQMALSDVNDSLEKKKTK